jgi:hypothetical protein
LKPDQRSSHSIAILIVSLPCGFDRSDIKKLKDICATPEYLFDPLQIGCARFISEKSASSG